MKTLIINFPDNVDITDREARLLLAAKGFEKGKLTLGQAAAIAGISKRVFVELINEYDLSPINASISDLDNDVTNARNYSF